MCRYTTWSCKSVTARPSPHGLWLPMFCRFIHCQTLTFLFFCQLPATGSWLPPRPSGESPDVQIKARASFYGNIALTNYPEIDVWVGDLMTCLNAGLLSSHCHGAAQQRLSSAEMEYCSAPTSSFVYRRQSWLYRCKHHTSGQMLHSDFKETLPAAHMWTLRLTELLSASVQLLPVFLSVHCCTTQWESATSFSHISSPSREVLSCSALLHSFVLVQGQNTLFVR